MTALALDALGAALTEWDRRYREEPERFASEAEHLAGTAEDYGEAAAPYLLEILAELGYDRVSIGTALHPGPTSREILERQAAENAASSAFPLPAEPEPGLLEEPGS